MYARWLVVITAAILWCTGCGSPGPQSDSDTGAVAFSVAWQGAPALSPGIESKLLLAAQLDCTAAGVSTVSAFAYSASDTLLASGGPWNCAAHSGTITNITPQSNIKILILAKDASDSTLYRGEQQGITVTAGQTTNAGSITATIFSPTLTAPAPGSTVINGSFNFNWTSTGASYEIQVASSSGFTSTVIDQTGITATLYTPITNLNAGTYYWRVRAIDSYGNASVWSAVGNFVVIAPKSITMFSFTSPAATGAIDENAKTIAVTVPYGTNVTALVAMFTTTGASVKVGSLVQVSGVTPNDFTNPVLYVVTATDGTTATYTVTVTIALNAAKAITAFSFISPAVTGAINENAKTIAVTVPYGTNVTALVAMFTTTGASVKVGTTVQVSGSTPNDFTSPVSYIVTAADSTAATYTVSVTIALNPAKAITAFSILSISGTINESAKTISLILPSGTDVTALVATFTTTGASVKVGSTIQVSGITPNDFTNPVTYTVTAADGTTATYTVTVTVVPIPIYPDVSAGSSHTLWLKSDGTVWAWGDNIAGALGDGTTTTRTRPVQVYNLTNVAVISAGALFSVALKSDGTVWAWGYNSYGALGDGTTTNRTTPVKVSGLTGVTAISAGGNLTLALRYGKVWAWGYNNFGQLGDGTTTNRTTPVQAVTSWIIVGPISAGFNFSIAQLTNACYVWGYNYYGQLGDGTTTSQTTPEEVVRSTPIVSAGGYHTLAVNSAGTAFAWGYNGYGQLGDGTTTIRTTAVQVSGMTGVAAISAGEDHSVALKSDGTVWTWGNNATGQLGDGTYVNRVTPVQVQ